MLQMYKIIDRHVHKIHVYTHVYKFIILMYTYIYKYIRLKDSGQWMFQSTNIVLVVFTWDYVSELPRYTNN